MSVGVKGKDCAVVLSQKKVPVCIADVEQRREANAYFIPRTSSLTLLLYHTFSHYRHQSDVSSLDPLRMRGLCRREREVRLRSSDISLDTKCHVMSSPKGWQTLARSTHSGYVHPEMESG